LRIEIAEESAASLEDYARVPIAFEIGHILDVARSLDGSEFLLEERALATPRVKDYDAVAGYRPLDWPDRFDLSSWRFLAARVNGRRVGGAAVVFRSQSVSMLEERDDLALLWDIRVSPTVRGRGIGAALLAAAENWVRQMGGRWLKVETQNTNAAACRFYGRQGFVLETVNRSIYPDFPEELQLLWYKKLGAL